MCIRDSSLPILPEEWQYAVDPDKGKQFKTLKELMHRADVSEVVNACDAGLSLIHIFSCHPPYHTRMTPSRPAKR